MTYDVTAGDGSKIGEIQKAFGKSLLRLTFLIHAPGGTVTAYEQSLPVAVFRRVVGFVPFIGEIADWLPIPYHFVFERDGQILGVHKRRFGRFRDVYDIDMSADAARSLIGGWCSRRPWGWTRCRHDEEAVERFLWLTGSGEVGGGRMGADLV